MGIRCADSLVRDTQPKAKSFQTRHLQQLDGFANHVGTSRGPMLRVRGAILRAVDVQVGTGRVQN